LLDLSGRALLLARLRLRHRREAGGQQQGGEAAAKALIDAHGTSAPDRSPTRAPAPE
jgi:hypothetical protein